MNAVDARLCLEQGLGEPCIHIVLASRLTALAGVVLLPSSHPWRVGKEELLLPPLTYS